MHTTQIRDQAKFRRAVAGRGLVLIQRSVHILQVLRLTDKIPGVYAQGLIPAPLVGITDDRVNRVFLGECILVRESILEQIVISFLLRLRQATLQISLAG